MNLSDLPIGTRCYEHDREGDALPRGGVVIGHDHAAEMVVVVVAHGHRSKGRRANVAFLEVERLRLEDVNPATVEPLGLGERARVARAIAGVLATRSGPCTDADVRDLDTMRELFDVAGRYAAGMAARLERARPVVDAATGELIRPGVGDLAVVGTPPQEAR